MMIQTLNIYLFNLINADTNTPSWIVEIARFMAEAPQYFLSAGILYVLCRQRNKSIYLFSVMTVSTVLALSLSKLTAYTFPVDRPFVTGLGMQWLDHGPNASFPSDHATFLFAIAGVSMWFNTQQWFSRFALALGLINGWARVCVGIHFPLDILGALIIGYLSGTLTILGHWLLSAYGQRQPISEEIL